MAPVNAVFVDNECDFFTAHIYFDVNFLMFITFGVLK